MQTNGRPLHVAIYSELKSKILSGELNPNDMLPSENEFARIYKTSRVTVRKSLKMLENEDLVNAWQGKGYYVSSPEHNNYTINFSDTERGFEVIYREVNVNYPSEDVAVALEIPTSKFVIEVCRLIKRRGNPVALDMKYIPYEKGMPTLEAELNYAVFPEIAAAKTAPFAFHTEMEICAELPGDAVAQQLQCPRHTPLLVVYRRLIDQGKRCIGYGVKYMLKEYGQLCAKSGYEL